jgi:glycosyltransferase involved in cell wall biosynthesis
MIQMESTASLPQGPSRKNESRRPGGRTRCAPIASIVIPAHNEERVIARCLQALLADAEPGEFEVIVACNGCRDRTAETARRFAPDVRVLETEIGSKTIGLNLGDQAASHFPRFYLDADILLPTDSVRKTVALMQDKGLLAAAPTVQWDLRRSSHLVRAFYTVWRYQPYFDGGQMGAGVYAVSQQGHARIGSFPDITADDEFVRQSFAATERGTAEDCVFTIVPPRTLANLIRIKTRSRRGNWELRRRFPKWSRIPRPSKRDFLGRLVRRPQLWPLVPVYGFVVASTWINAWRTTRSGKGPRWERDLSSR